MTAKHCPLEFHDVLLPNAFLPGIFHGQAPLPVFGRACNMRLNNAHAPSARELWRSPGFLLENLRKQYIYI